jgi:hypothetical protein
MSPSLPIVLCLIVTHAGATLLPLLAPFGGSFLPGQRRSIAVAAAPAAGRLNPIRGAGLELVARAAVRRSFCTAIW